MTWRGVCAMLRLILHDEPVLVASDPERFNEKRVRREMAINITMLWLGICGLSINFVPSLLTPPLLTTTSFFRDPLAFQNNLAERLGAADMPVQ